MNSDGIPATRVHAFLDLVTLTYHEARNVRWLIRAGFAELGAYEPLLQLAKNKFAAWEQLRPLREQAYELGVQDGLRVFASRFHCDLAALVELFGHEGWRGNEGLGGNRWREIAATIVQLGDALASGDETRASMLERAVHSMRHNTGVVAEKLALLEGSRSAI